MLLLETLNFAFAFSGLHLLYLQQPNLGLQLVQILEFPELAFEVVNNSNFVQLRKVLLYVRNDI